MKPKQFNLTERITMGNTEQLTADVTKWVTKEIELIGKRTVAAAAIAVAEEAAGAAFLDSSEGEGGASVEAVLRLRATLVAIESGIRAAGVRRLAAVKAQRASGAAGLRDQVTKLRAEQAKIEAEVAKHTAAIGKILEAEVVPVLAGGGDLSKLQRLQAQINALLTQAAGLEGELPRHGTVEVDNITDIEPLLADVLKSESETPSTAAIRGWAEDVERKAGLAFGEYPRCFHLVWRDGKIDAKDSYIRVPDLGRTEPGMHDGSPIPLPGTDTFRAPHGFGS